MPTDLHFPLPAVLRLAEHAVAATDHNPTYGEQLDGAACAAALEWVADDGTYLMSNGLPALLRDPDDDTSNVVVFAHGWGPGSDRSALGSTDVGHDDFCEHLHLTGAEGARLLTMLRRATAANYPWFVLTVDGDQVSYSCRTDGAPTT